MLIKTSDKTAGDAPPGSPLPTQIVSNGEYVPVPQTRRQAAVQARMTAMADERARARRRYRERGPAPSLRTYGPRTRREFFRYVRAHPGL